MRRALLVAPLLALAGCGGEPPAGVATYEASGSGGDDALLVGTVAIVDDCTYVEDETGRVLPVFPDDDVPELADGDEVSLGGGYREEVADEWRIPGSCETGQVFAVAQG